MVEVKISGVTYDATNDYEIRQQSGQTTMATIEVKLDGKAVPDALQEAQILIDGEPIFWGNIQDVESPEFCTGSEVQRYSLSIQSGDGIFQRRLVAESYTNVYTHQIIADLFDKYLAAEGITLGSISNTDRYFESYAANYEQLSDVLQELADELNAVYYISPDKKFYFLVRNDFQTVAIPDKLTSLKKSVKAGDLRTVQLVAGATEQTSQQVRTVVWATDQAEQALGYPISVEPVIKINGTTAGVGIRGLEESDESITFLWSSGSNIITLNTNATTKPAVGATVEITYYGYYDIMVTNVNDALVADIAAKSGTSGRIEKLVTDVTIENYQDADTRSAALLDAYNEPEQEITCKCLDVTASQLFNMWPLSFSDVNIEGNYVIVERVIKPYIITDDEIVHVCALKLKNRNFYSRYGTALKKFEKRVGSDAVIYKNSALGDVANTAEEWSFESAGTVAFPSSTGIVEPAVACVGGSFYPM